MCLWWVCWLRSSSISPTNSARLQRRKNYSITRWLAEKDLIDKVRIYEFMEKEITERSVDEMGEVHLKNISEALDILYWR